MSERQSVFDVQVVLLDVEGTTSSIRFVYDVMFPYVRDNVAAFLEQNWKDSGVQESVQIMGKHFQMDSAEHWQAGRSDSEFRAVVHRAVTELMDGDVKETGLKQLQGLIWKDGFESKQMVAHLFDDVADAMTQWQQQGIEIRIYSSGSVAAQKLFFGHTIRGNLLP